ncbi:MAG: adenylate/guanylate cyclase domain-containing protein [Chloroflexi bacterium]|nr:adenylate/guanylate cyclase domain-containing protein [Chloroflexota bacterium]
MAARSSKRFYDLLLEYSQAEDPGLRKGLEATLWENYGQEQTVFVLDMSGFSRLTRKYGIIHYLSMVRRMQLTTEPIVKSFDGYMIKYEADNCFAVFPTPLQAVHAAIAMQHAFDAANILTADDLDIRIACGIDYGKILIVGRDDCFGDAVNRASKMGEDIAEAGEILVTKEAMQMIPNEAGIKAREVNLSVSGITIPAFAIEYRATT